MTNTSNPKPTLKSLEQRIASLEAANVNHMIVSLALAKLVCALDARVPSPVDADADSSSLTIPTGTDPAADKDPA